MSRSRTDTRRVDPPFPTFPLGARSRKDTGSTLVWVLTIVVLMAGSSVAFLALGHTNQVRAELQQDSVRALEACEIGIVRAKYELARNEDVSGDEVIGDVAGTVHGGSYTVSAAPVDLRHVALTARGESADIDRRVQVVLRQRPTTVFSQALAGVDDVRVAGGFMTDSYDSLEGSYADQAVNEDESGVYARAFGDISSNGTLSLSGSDTTVRGIASAGPGEQATIEGTPLISGGVSSLTAPLEFPAPPAAEFYEAYATNDNGAIEPGHGIDYDPETKALVVDGGATLSLEPGTYFFSSLFLSGRAEIQVSGETRIYMTGNLDASGGSITNLTEQASDLSILVHPYTILDGVPPPDPLEVHLAGSASTALTVYAPEADVYISGGSDLFGAVVGRTIDARGAQFHYDEALGFEDDIDFQPYQRVAWREIGNAPE